MDRIIGFFEVMSYEKDVPVLIDKIVSIIKTYDDNRLANKIDDSSYLNTAFKYSKYEYLTALPNRLEVNDKATIILHVVAKILLSKISVSDVDNINNNIDKLALVKNLIVINPDYVIQKVNAFGPLIAVMKNIKPDAVIDKASIINLVDKIYLDNTAAYERYLNIFNIRYGYFIEYIVDSIYDYIKTDESDANIYKLAIWMIINSHL